MADIRLVSKDGETVEGSGALSEYEASHRAACAAAGISPDVPMTRRTVKFYTHARFLAMQRAALDVIEMRLYDSKSPGMQFSAAQEVMRRCAEMMPRSVLADVKAQLDGGMPGGAVLNSVLVEFLAGTVDKDTVDTVVQMIKARREVAAHDAATAFQKGPRQ